jgi:hypothetical protein
MQTKKEQSMVNEMINNPITEVVEQLALMAAIFIPLMIAVVQGIKKLTGIEGVKAQVTAIAVNLSFGLGFTLVFFYPEAAVYVGVVMFLLILGVAPLGGYDLLKYFVRDPDEKL